MHKVSVTINVREHEWPAVGGWVYDHFGEISGISFLPYSDHVYQQAPYQPVDEAEYIKLEAAMPKNINWAGLRDFEKSDETTTHRELACTAGSCEL
jgi:ribonucleoside-diphosphate reductase alpha chain